jgi:hypothetical protein
VGPGRPRPLGRGCECRCGLRVRAGGRAARPLRGNATGPAPAPRPATPTPPTPAGGERRGGVGWVRGGVGAGGVGRGYLRGEVEEEGRVRVRGVCRGGGVGQASMAESSSGDPHPRPHRAAAGLGGGAWQMRGKACACHARPVACARSRPLYLSPVPCAADVADAIPMRQRRACPRRVSAFDFPASVKSANDRCRIV